MIVSQDHPHDLDEKLPGCAYDEEHSRKQIKRGTACSHQDWQTTTTRGSLQMNWVTEDFWALKETLQ